MSIVEVAKVAGVSHTTVSRFVNKSAKVNVETAKRISEAMEKVGYVPKPPHLRRGPTNYPHRDFKTKNLAFLTVSNSIRILTSSPFLIDLVHGIEQAASDNGISLFQGILNPHRPLPPFLTRNEVDGLIIYPGLENVPQDYVKVLKRFPIVFVLSGRDQYFIGDRVMCNHERIGKMAADYLIENGHKRVIYFDVKSSPSYQSSLFTGRWNRFQELCDIAGVEAHKIVIPLTSEETLIDGPVVKNILKEVVNESIINKTEAFRPTGIFTIFDSLTAVLYPVLQSCGIKIGDDLDIISCNNEVSLLAGLHPRPATIDLQSEIIGQRAFERMCQKIRLPKDQARVTLEIEPKIIRSRN
jgi:DNA-binding LacI/PurR family transcriptional regulator